MMPLTGQCRRRPQPVFSPMHNITTICFDLDDTLWDMAPVIPRAEQRLHDWFRTHFPRVAELYSPTRMCDLRVHYAKSFPELRHDLSELRLRMLREVLAAAEYDEAHAERAFEVFYRARNDVEVFADVAPALERLAQTHTLYALTNGNASLDTIGLARYFSGVFAARELGVAKPAPEFFARVLKRAKLDAAQTLHVGDHPENDVCAPKTLGFYTVWLNRAGADWQHEHCAPDHELSSLTPLPELLAP